jgi:Zn-dependent protease
MDRDGLVSDLPTEPQRDYEPIHPQSALRDLLRKIWAPIAFIGGLAVKFGFVFFKFFALFIAVGGYALLWGWRFGAGVVALILVHEMGHYLTARKLGLHPSLPMFVPFFGAYVAFRNTDPWRHARVALAGPALGGVGALAALFLGEQTNSDLLRALAYFGFLLNLVNMIPVGILDGGAILSSTRWLYRGGFPNRAYAIGGAAVAVALFLVWGMYAAHVPQHRL